MTDNSKIAPLAKEMIACAFGHAGGGTYARDGKVVKAAVWSVQIRPHERLTIAIKPEDRDIPAKDKGQVESWVTNTLKNLAPDEALEVAGFRDAVVFYPVRLCRRIEDAMTIMRDTSTNRAYWQNGDVESFSIWMSKPKQG